MRVTAGRGFHGERVAFSLPSTLNRAYTDNYSVPYYIFAQIFGAFIAGMLLMGMSVALQIVGQRLQEEKVLAVMQRIEDALDKNGGKYELLEIE